MFFSDSGELIKKIYNTQSLQCDTEDKNLAETKDKLFRLVTIENNMIKINEYTKIVISSLSKKLDDNHPRIRAKAAFALGKIGSRYALT